MIALDLFSGCGGGMRGLHQAGIKHALGVEFEEAPAETARRAGFPVVTADVRDMSVYEGLPPIDLLSGGPPCQDFSTAGSRAAQHGDRNGWPWTLDVIDKVRPKWVLLENVRGILFHSKDCKDPCPACYFHGWIIPAFKERFDWVDFAVLNASDLGVPQHRRRVFVVAGPGPVRWPQPTHADPATLNQTLLFARPLKPWVTVRQALGISGACLGGGRNPGSCEDANSRSYRNLTDEPSTTISVSVSGTSGPFIEEKPAWWYRATDPDEPSRTIGSKANAALLERPSPCVSSSEYKGTNAKKDGTYTWSGGPPRASDAVFLATGRRRLTIEEVAILQDFPPDYPFQGTKEQKYRMIGNAWPAAFGRALGASIIEANEELNS